MPICTVVGMEAVLRFPSYGELSDMGGPGPSLGRLYEEGNAYIRRHAEWLNYWGQIGRFVQT